MNFGEAVAVVQMLNFGEVVSIGKAVDFGEAVLNFGEAEDFDSGRRWILGLGGRAKDVVN